MEKEKLLNNSEHSYKMGDFFFLCSSPSGKISVEGGVIYCSVISALGRHSCISVIATVLLPRFKHVNVTLNRQLKLFILICYTINVIHNPLESKSHGFK